LVIIKWYGHACFEIIDSKGRSIVIDPHDGRSIGIKPPKTQAHAVLITHEHFDHNAYQGILRSDGVVYSMKTGKFMVFEHEVLGLKSYHDKVRGKRRGEVVIYKVNVEGVRIVHLGDLGYIPSDDELKNLIPVDILMTPVGGTFTIDAKEALQLSDKLSPKVIIPMHYWVEGINLPLLPLSEFLKLVTTRKIINLESNTWSVSVMDIPENVVVVFKLM